MQNNPSTLIIAFKLISALYKQGEISEELYRKVQQNYSHRLSLQNPYPCGNSAK